MIIKNQKSIQYIMSKFIRDFQWSCIKAQKSFKDFFRFSELILSFHALFYTHNLSTYSSFIIQSKIYLFSLPNQDSSEVEFSLFKKEMKTNFFALIEEHFFKKTEVRYRNFWCLGIVLGWMNSRHFSSGAQNDVDEMNIVNEPRRSNKKKKIFILCHFMF